MDDFKILTDLLSAEEIKLLEKWITGKPSGAKIQSLKGHDIIPDFNAESIEFLYDKWKINKGDVITVSYPKTGTVWLGEIVRQILYHNDKKILDLVRCMPAQLLFLELSGVDKFSIIDQLPFERREFLTHVPATLFNFKRAKEAGAKFVYIYRNPKDEMVSWYKFCQNLPIKDMEPFKSMITSGWDKYFEHVVAGDFHMHMKPGEWYPDHILSWYPHRDNENVYFVAYEDLKKDLCKEVKKIAEFLAVSVDDETAEDIASACGFERMKQVVDEKSVLSSTHMRKGQVGGWKDYFTVSQSERLDAIMEEKLKDTNIKFTYEL